MIEVKPWNNNERIAEENLIKYNESERFQRARHQLIDASWTKTAIAASRFGECVNLDDIGISNAFANQLCNAIALLDFERRGRVVEENDADIAAVILIDDAGPNVDEIFHS